MKLKKYSEFSDKEKGWAMNGLAMCSKVKDTDTLKDWLFDRNGWPQKRIEEIKEDYNENNKKTE